VQRDSASGIKARLENFKGIELCKAVSEYLKKKAG
jgi:hypothetical protein